MNPTPSKRRRSSSPAGPGPGPGPIPRPSQSPTESTRRPISHPILPAPIPSPHISGPSFPLPFSATTAASAAPGPSNWQQREQQQQQQQQVIWRRSMDARSPPSSTGSPKLEGIDEAAGDVGMVFARDTASRAPRSMMACTRCRRQKMKCDGPAVVPCRGCRQANQPCIFEARSRPKSISSLPSRPPPFYAGSLQQPRPGTPTGFYPSSAQPAPPITSRPIPPPEPYALRQAREPMPPPPATSISVIASPFAPPRPSSPPQQSLPPAYHPPPLQLPPFSGSGPPPPTSAGGISNTESRLRSLESAIRSISSLPQTIGAIQTSLVALQRSHDALALAVSGTISPRLRASIDVDEVVWESYRSRAWPLTPWLVGLRESQGLPGIVVNFLGKRTIWDRSEAGRRGCEETLDEVLREVGRLIGEKAIFTREEVRALGVFATWTNEPTLALLAIGHARVLDLDKLHAPRRTHDDWREWIYASIMDHLCQISAFNNPTTVEPLAAAWRERLANSVAGDPAVRDRDLRLLAWLEYAETLAEVFRSQQSSRGTASSEMIIESAEETISERGSVRSHQTGGAGAALPSSDEGERRKPLDIWRRYAPRWEAWAGSWSVRNDPILSLHFNYAVLFTACPLFLGAFGVIGEMAASHEGYSQLERGRDAAFAVVQAVCSPEIGRTLAYSFPLYRPLLSLAILHLTALCTYLPASPIISLPHVQTVLRSTLETLSTPVLPLGIGAGGGIGLLGEMVERGDVSGVVKREFGGGVELGKDVWRRILG
ncbi:hypothetical protein BCR39DRAFT_87706 [Naematelia encephala]|uniref:Zn(2)-C6 fungal-type domain-containing protein n=1 Tax=Naematelia encephala TaxID=71784 RepID=A0A1Y2BAD3_9TREE|nr:hypothetical protein BCR39DRAFT_87706 [Naematelia encephala]